MFKGQPKGLIVLFFANMGERFGFYTMLSVFTFFLQANFGWDEKTATSVYGAFLAGIYFVPLFGGLLADRVLGYGKTIVLGTLIMTAGYALLAVPTGNEWMVYASLATIAIGNGLFKGNLVVIVGNLYESKELSALRDAAFNIFYMGINIGAFFAPYAASGMKDYFHETLGMTLAQGYNAAFAVAGVGMILSLLVFVLFRKHYAEADYRAKDKKKTANDPAELTPKQERDRITALLIVFGIVVFFWMAFHQNGAALSLFARDYTVSSVSRAMFMLFDLPAFLSVIAALGSIIFLLRPGMTGRTRGIAAATLVVAAGVGYWRYSAFGDANALDPELFQSFNPIFIVFLTPLVVGIFASLNAQGKEPSSPGKIGIGMLVTAIGFAIMVAASMGLPGVYTLSGHASPTLVSPFWLISTYFTLTVAELFLSPMGLSFVSKVAPPRLRGLMQGGWLCATAVGNYLAGFIGRFYQSWELWQFFLLLVVAALISATLVALVLKKLKAATA
jgi:POT family proton-dependent oligopeptide transporter